jgi:hypothetical protein
MKKRKPSKIILVGPLLLAMGALSYVVFALTYGQRVVLVAKSKLDVFASPNPEAGDLPLFSISPGEEISVKWCDDNKTDIVPFVKASDGKAGFVGIGEYDVTAHKSALLELPNLFYYSCAPLFR